MFREYFQALALVDRVSSGGSDWIGSVLSRRPLPEEVAAFFAELAPAEVVARLIESISPSGAVSESFVNNIGRICSFFDSKERVQDLLRRASAHHRLSLKLSDMDLDGLDFSQRNLVGTLFTKCRLRGADFRRAILEDIAFNECDLTDAKFEGAEGHMAVFDYGTRVFGTLPILRELVARGADCGPMAEQEKVFRDEWQDRVRHIVEGRLRRFYIPGASGPEGSKWDTSIQERNLLGGLDASTKRFVATKVVPEMVGLGMLRREREHGVVIYRLESRTRDDARALIERQEFQGLVDQLIDRLM